MSRRSTASRHVDPPVAGTKICPRCHLTLHVLAFSADHASSDGLYHYCRDCTSARNQDAYDRRKRRTAFSIDELYDRGFEPRGDD